MINSAASVLSQQYTGNFGRSNYAAGNSDTQARLKRASESFNHAPRASEIRKQIQMQFGVGNMLLNSDEQNQVNSYFNQIDNIFGVNNEPMREEQVKRYRELEAELNEIRGIPNEPKELTLAEKEKVADLQDQLDELYGLKPTKEPEGADLRKAESLKWELKKLHYPEGRVLNAAEQRKEKSIRNELKDLFGIEGPKTLTEEEQEQADSLNKQIEELYGYEHKELTENEKARANQILDEMEQIVGNLATEGLSRQEKNLFWQFHNRSNELMETANERELNEKEKEELSEINGYIDQLLDKAEKIQSQQDSQAGTVYSQMGGFLAQRGINYGGTLFSANI